MLCTAYAHSNRTAQAKLILMQLNEMHEKASAGSCAFDLEAAQGHTAQARALLDKLAEQYPLGDLGAFDIGDDYAMIGIYDKALEWLTRAYDQREFVLFTVSTDATIPRAFFQTPGWKSLWSRPLVRAWQAAHDELALELAKRPTD
jgi:tetratricopeptide (TPR) repeat protein